jgi:hypothetical protein
MDKMEKASEKNLEIRLKTGAISEKGLAFSLLQKGLRRDIELDWDYKAWWIGDIIAVAIFEQYEMPEKKEEKEFWSNRENLDKVVNYLAKLKEEFPTAYDRDVPNAEFDCDDVRKRTGKHRLSNKEVFDLVKKFVGSPIVRMTKTVIAEDGDSYAIPGEIDNVCKIQFLKTGKFSNRNKEAEYHFRAIFDRAASLDFWNCVRLRLFDYRAPSYYSLKAGSQLIFRAMGWTKGISRLTLDELCRIAGIKSKNITIQQKIIESYLSELQEKKWINSYLRDIKREGFGGKKRILYTIFKRKELPRK